MAGEGDEIRPQGGGGEGYLQKALDGVGVEKGGTVLQQGGHLFHREADAGFVVYQHHGHQGGVLPKGGGHLLGRNAAGAVGLHQGDFIALLLQGLEALEDGAVLHGGGHDVLAHPAVLPEGGADGPVVALRAAGGEEKLLRFAPQGLRHSGTALLHQIPGRPAQGVLGGGVAEVLRQNLYHDLRHRSGYRGGGGIIQIVHRGLLIRRPNCGLSRRGMYTIINKPAEGPKRAKSSVTYYYIDRKEKRQGGRA